MRSSAFLHVFSYVLVVSILLVFCVCVFLCSSYVMCSFYTFLPPFYKATHPTNDTCYKICFRPGSRYLSLLLVVLFLAAVCCLFAVVFCVVYYWLFVACSCLFVDLLLVVWDWLLLLTITDCNLSTILLLLFAVCLRCRPLIWISEV